ncbi:CPBP family intramembrane metalloprotease [Candidatus Bathyarchaeota archaeon]|nr:CPBP family intramembrane metalloprotease [Candidatus Bathyarchaeota archaeon]MBS7636589.1 CPBP family intramembrane metalloprotease [Candidatus Bathyarchaeota archaeon]
MNRFIVYYFSLVLLIGGLAYAPWVLASYSMFPSDLVFVFVMVGGVSPTIAALIVAKLECGRGGAEYLFDQFGHKGFSKLWFLVAVLVPLALAACAVLLWSIAGGTHNLNLTKLAEFPPILIASFLMNMWEEIGWRGYALPTLQKKHNALISSLIVGVFWALWHWPHFAVKDSAMAVNYHNFLWFAIFTLFYSISYTWLYNITEGSLLTASLYHASTNAANTILFVEANITSSIFPYYFLTIIILALIIIFTFKTDSLSNKKRAIFK